jgi:hypothetical protein
VDQGELGGRAAADDSNRQDSAREHQGKRATVVESTSTSIERYWTDAQLDRVEQHQYTHTVQEV